MTELTETELLEASLARIWNERDDARRMAAMGEIYAPDAVIYEPDRQVTGHAQISAVVAGVLADMPPDFRFEVTGPTLGHHGVAVTRWAGGSPGKVMVSGTDAARTADGRIREHWFFFDPAS